jgi:hypothetical protein
VAPAQFAALLGGLPEITPQNLGLLISCVPELALPVEAGEAEAAVGYLAAQWRGALGQLNEEVDRYFRRPGGANEVLPELKAVFTKFGEYHQRGEVLLARAFAAAPPAWLGNLKPLKEIFYEMRKFGRN